MQDDITRAAEARKGSPFLNTDQAAFYVSLTSKTLGQMRTDGTGPKFRKHGSIVRYHIADLIAWSEANSHTSTQPRLGHGGSGRDPDPRRG
jgi:hypothetical protein